MAAFRSPPNGRRSMPGSAYLTACLVVLIFVPMISLPVTLLVNAAFPSAWAYPSAQGIAARIGEAVSQTLMFITYAPFFSWAAMIFAVPLSMLALRFGYAGWASACLAGAALGGVAATILSHALIFHGQPIWLPMILTGAFYGWVYGATIIFFFNETPIES